MSLSVVVFSLLAPPRQRPTSARHATATDLLLGRPGHRREWAALYRAPSGHTTSTARVMMLPSGKRYPCPLTTVATSSRPRTSVPLKIESGRSLEKQSKEDDPNGRLLRHEHRVPLHNTHSDQITVLLTYNPRFS